MNKMSKVSSYFLIAMLLLGVFFVATPASVKAVPPTMVALVNPTDSSNNFVYTTSEKDVGDFFLINVTITDVLNMSGWQMSISWNASLLSYNSFKLPTDNVFAYDSPVSAVSASSGNVVGGANLGPDAPYYFNGSGTLAVLNLTIIQGVGILPPTTVQCDLQFTNVGDESYLLEGLIVMPFTPVNGIYLYYWVAPSTIPKLYLKPSEIKPDKIGDTFLVDVMVENVYAGWEITCFQFSIMWNTTLIAPTNGTTYLKGTFLETFEYGVAGVIYASDLNTHDRVPPLLPIPDDYNYSIVGELLLPDMADPWNGTYHQPYPESIGPAKLATFNFTAMFNTTAPEELWTKIEFIAKDVLVLNHYSTDMGYTTLTGADYRCPMVTTGRSIDVYTQYHPYGGQGGNKTSDSFGPQQLVQLIAEVKYNDYAVQQKLVGYQIFHQPTGSYAPFNFTREDGTDADGIANVTFRLPWPCDDPTGQIFGWWYVNATVEIAETTVVDNLKFWVWWPVEVVSIEPKFTSINHAAKPNPETGLMEFRMIYLTYHQQAQSVLLTGTIYDELSFYIGGNSKFLSDIWDIPPNVQPLLYPLDLVPTDEVNTTKVNDFVYDVLPYFNGTNFYPAIWTWEFSVPLKSNAVVGLGTAFGNAFNDWPWNAGTPYCPEARNTLEFRIAKPI